MATVISGPRSLGQPCRTRRSVKPAPQIRSDRSLDRQLAHLGLLDDAAPIFRDGSRVFFLVGDVSGKGIAAALFMARAKTVFEAVASREADPAALLATVNRSLCRDNDAGMFVTAVAGVLDLASGDLAFSLAGHEPPVLIPADGAPEPW